MSHDTRQLLIDWTRQGRIKHKDLPAALRLVDELPTTADWARFVDRLLLYLGGLLTAGGIVFFFAYNWNALGRFTQFALGQGVIVACLIAIVWLGVGRLGGRLALMLAAVSVGVLLALIGQTYQTGADTYELFLYWALLIVPWALLARIDELWMLLLALFNVALVLYYSTFNGLFGWGGGSSELLWLLFFLNALALLIWEALVLLGIAKRRKIRWMTRLLATITTALISTLAIFAIFAEFGMINQLLAMPVWMLWLLLLWFWHGRRDPDLYVLSLGVLAVVAVLNTWLGHVLFSVMGFGATGFFIIAVGVITVSSLGAGWLRRIANTHEADV